MRLSAIEASFVAPRNGAGGLPLLVPALPVL
jgi:hypothetical protein